MKIAFIKFAEFAPDVARLGAAAAVGIKVMCPVGAKECVNLATGKFTVAVAEH